MELLKNFINISSSNTTKSRYGNGNGYGNGYGSGYGSGR